VQTVHVIGELNGLGASFLSIMENNLNNPERWKKLKKIKGSLVATERDSGVSITLFFDKGNIQLQSGTISNPSASLKSDFDTVAAYSSGDLNPFMGVLKGKISVRGNVFKLLKMVEIVRSD
jgi:putative sterol carrier protein